MGALVASPNVVLKGLNASFMEGVQEVRPSLVPRLAQRIESDTLSEKYVYPTAVAKPRKWVDDRVPTNIDALLLFELLNDTFEVTLKIKGDLIMDAKAFGFSDLMREAGMSMAMYPDELISLLIKNGATAGNLAYDGNVFYSDTHFFAGNTNGSNIDNKLAGTGTTVAQIKADVQTAIGALRTFVDDKGRLINPIRAGADQLAIVCHPSIEWNVREALNAAIISNTSNILQGAADVLPDGYQTDLNDWTLHFTGMPTKPFIFQDREPINTSVIGFDSEEYKKTGYVWIVGRMRLKMGYHRFERSILTVN